MPPLASDNSFNRIHIFFPFCICDHNVIEIGNDGSIYDRRIIKMADNSYNPYWVVDSCFVIQWILVVTLCQVLDIFHFLNSRERGPSCNTGFVRCVLCELGTRSGHKKIPRASRLHPVPDHSTPSVKTVVISRNLIVTWSPPQHLGWILAKLGLLSFRAH